MSDDRNKQRSEADAELEREIRQGRKFTAKDAIARMLGPGAMKGGSAVSKVQEAETGIGTWLRSNLTDSTEHCRRCCTVSSREARNGDEGWTSGPISTEKVLHRTQMTPIRTIPSARRWVKS
jgi:hypothetical protein